MLCCRKRLMECHVFVECMSSGYHILQYMLCFTEKHFFTGGHVILEGTYYRKACFAVRDV